MIVDLSGFLLGSLWIFFLILKILVKILGKVCVNVLLKETDLDCLYVDKN